MSKNEQKNYNDDEDEDDDYDYDYSILTQHSQLAMRKH